MSKSIIKITLASMALIVVLLVFVTSIVSNQTTASTAGVVSYQNFQQANSLVHVVTIPKLSQYKLMPVVGEELATVEKLAEAAKAIAAINGGYFDPVNGQTTSYITIAGETVAEPRNNRRLIDNPDLKSYLPQILNRSELRGYQCGQEIAYDITLHTNYTPKKCNLLFSLGAGPQLLPEITAVEEGFSDYQNEQIIRDAIGSYSPNARSAVGIKANGDIVLVMVAQTTSKNSGMSLSELAEFLSKIGVEKALNLDGGSSASLYYRGSVFFGRLDREGNTVERLVKSILVVK